MPAAGVQAAGVPSPLDSRASPAAAAILHVCLFVTIFSLPMTFTDPSAYEFLVFPLLVACIAARVSLDVKLMPFVALGAVFLAGGFASLAPVMGDAYTVRYQIISCFLVVTGVMYACIFSQDCVRRFSIMRSALVPASTIAAFLGIIGYFQLVPGEMFTLDGRAVGPTKHPNILGAVLVFPLLLVIEHSITRKVSAYYVAAGCIMLLGILLSFSRGSWGNFAVATVLTVGLISVTTAERRIRRRALFLSLAALAVGVLLLSVALSIPEVREMFEQRFRLVQDYDAGTSGARFSIQARGIEEILRNPNGMGPMVFGKTYGLVPHNSFIGSMLNQGWVGGSAFYAIVLSTLAIGLRAVFIRTKWQTLLIVSYAEFAATVLHSFVDDSEHFRPFYLFTGLVWGLSVASLNVRRERTAADPVPPQPDPGGARTVRLARPEPAGVFRIRFPSP